VSNFGVIVYGITVLLLVSDGVGSYCRRSTPRTSNLGEIFQIEWKICRCKMSNGVVNKKSVGVKPTGHSGSKSPVTSTIGVQMGSQASNIN
jgi:hypothetical protein